jgi:hypothetical protein
LCLAHGELPNNKIVHFSDNYFIASGVSWILASLFFDLELSRMSIKDRVEARG